MQSAAEEPALRRFQEFVAPGDSAAQVCWRSGPPRLRLESKSRGAPSMSTISWGVNVLTLLRAGQHPIHRVGALTTLGYPRHGLHWSDAAGIESWR